MSELEQEGSEFGRGIVVCLAKFSEHLSEHGPYSERVIREYADWTPEKEARHRASAAQYPKGDSAQMLARMEVAELGERVRGGDKAKNIDSMIRLWMNAASDHFYDLDPRAPKPLRELAALTLRIGHGFSCDEQYTIETIDLIRKLWRESCIAVDGMLGVMPDWGTW